MLINTATIRNSVIRCSGGTDSKSRNRLSHDPPILHHQTQPRAYLPAPACYRRIHPAVPQYHRKLTQGSASAKAERPSGPHRRLPPLRAIQRRHRRHLDGKRPTPDSPPHLSGSVVLVPAEMIPTRWPWALKHSQSTAAFRPVLYDFEQEQGRQSAVDPEERGAKLRSRSPEQTRAYG
jgi:hypothetical protein